MSVAFGTTRAPVEADYHLDHGLVMFEPVYDDNYMPILYDIFIYDADKFECIWFGSRRTFEQATEEARWQGIIQ